MEKQSVNINIFGRQFPATVDEEEAVVIKEAVRTINAKIKAFKAEYKSFSRILKIAPMNYGPFPRPLNGLKSIGNPD